MAKLSVALTAAQAETLAKIIEGFAAPRGSGGPENLTLATILPDGVRCTSGGIGCHFKLPTGLQEPICFPAHALSLAVLTAKADVQLTRETETTLLVRTGNFQGRFAVIDPDRAVAWPDEPMRWQPVTPEGWAGVSQVRFACAERTDKFHPEMAVVLSTGGIAYGCDNYRVCRCKATGWPDGFLPTELLDAVGKSGLGSPQQVVLAVDKAWLRFEDGTICWCATPGVEYPRTIIERIRECSRALTVSALGWDPTQVLQAVQRVTIFTTPDQPVSITGEGKTVLFRAVSPLGEAKETVRATVREPATINIQAGMLLEAVGKFEDCAINMQEQYALFRTSGKELMIVGNVT